jgi:hypothetical protein
MCGARCQATSGGEKVVLGNGDRENIWRMQTKAVSNVKT